MRKMPGGNQQCLTGAGPQTSQIQILVISGILDKEGRLEIRAKSINAYVYSGEYVRED